MKVDLSKFNNSWLCHGRSFLMRSIWYAINVLFFQNSLNWSSGLKVFLLRLFGAKIDNGVIVKPGVNVKYPWNLKIGHHSWIGESVWLDSIGPIEIGCNVCISQGVYCCTGNHDWKDVAFGLIVKPICIEDGAWVPAAAIVLPGVTVANHSVISAGSIIKEDTEPYTIYAGNPAVPIGMRRIDGNEF